MATKKWFVLVDGEEMGPLGPGGLRKLVRKGEIKAETLLRREDHTEAVPASRVCGILPSDPAEDEDIPTLTSPERPHRRTRIYGPFTELRMLGWSTAGAMFAFALLGAIGVYVAYGQVQFVERFATGTLLVEEGDMPLFGIGVFAVLALVAVGGLFMWWIWTARVNLPHLINARMVHPPSWAVFAWIAPFMNFVKPYQVVGEIDRLSAEAEADGDATIAEKHELLVPWWTAAILGTIAALTYMLTARNTIEDLSFAAWLHMFAGACTFLSGVLAGWIVLRVTNNQLRAHERHPEPVELHHEFGRRLRRVRTQLEAAAH